MTTKALERGGCWRKLTSQILLVRKKWLFLAASGLIRKKEMEKSVEIYSRYRNEFCEKPVLSLKWILFRVQCSIRRCGVSVTLRHASLCHAVIYATICKICRDLCSLPTGLLQKVFLMTKGISAEIAMAWPFVMQFCHAAIYWTTHIYKCAPLIV